MEEFKDCRKSKKEHLIYHQARIEDINSYYIIVLVFIIIFIITIFSLFWI